MDNDNFISAIHNYCDRWCERCEFTSRCRVFAMEAEMAIDEDAGDEAVVRHLTNILHDAKTMLEQKAAEFGIDLSGIDDEKFAADEQRHRSTVESSFLCQMAEKYAADMEPVLVSREEWLAADLTDEDVLGEVIGVLLWYQYFIAAKIDRGVGGVIDFDGSEDTEEINDPQSDANGSIKAALIAIERSLLAWTYLLCGDNERTIRPLIVILEELKRSAEARFPHAWDFIRPGFDEIETVM